MGQLKRQSVGQLTDNHCKKLAGKVRQLTAQTVNGIAGATVSRIAEVKVGQEHALVTTTRTSVR